MKHVLVLFIICMLFHMNSLAQLSPGTVLWSETWDGGNGNLSDYQFTGTTTYGNASLEYSGSAHISWYYSPNFNYNPQLFISGTFIASGIPTGGAPLLILSAELEVPAYQFTLTVDNSAPISFDYKNNQWIINNVMKKDFITIKFTSHYDSRTLDNICLKVGDPDTAPIIQPPGGSYSDNQQVTITSNNPDAIIYYTVDGTDPTGDNGMLYDSPILVSSTQTIRAVAVPGLTTHECYTKIDPSFDINGIYYQIISLDNNTVSAIGLVDNNSTTITIPANVVYSGRSFSVIKLDFPNEIGKKLNKINLQSVFEEVTISPNNAKVLTIRCHDNANIVFDLHNFTGGDWDKHYFQCEHLKITGNNIGIGVDNSYYYNGNSRVYYGNIWPELKKFEIKGSAGGDEGGWSGGVGRFMECPKLTTLDLGSSILFGDVLQTNFNHSPCYGESYSQCEFLLAPIDTLFIGNVRFFTNYDGYYNGANNKVHAFPLSQNHNRVIQYNNTDAAQRNSLCDSLNELIIPACVTKTWGKCASKVNHLKIEHGAPISEGIERGCSHGIQFIDNTEAKTVFFDRDASLYMLNSLKCEQLTIGEHVISKGTGDATIDVRGDSAFVKIYQMEPPALGNLFVNNTYVQVPLYVPKGTKTAYSTADNWKNFFNIIEFNWEGPEQTITVINDHPESGTVTGAGTYHWGDNVTLTAIPNEGCAFSQWIEDGNTIGTELTYSFVVNRDRTISASFSGTGIVEATSQLTISTEGGRITINGADEASIVSVYNIQGQKIYHGLNKTINISSPGLYVVAIENKTTKVVVE